MSKEKEEFKSPFPGYGPCVPEPFLGTFPMDNGQVITGDTSVCSLSPKEVVVIINGQKITAPFGGTCGCI